MKIPSRKDALEYLKGQAFSQFVGFYVGLSSSGLVSQFFETRSVSNLWGILAEKPVVDAQTFNVLERIFAVLIGFVVFEIVSKNLRPLVQRWKPIVVREIARRRKEQRWDERAKKMLVAARRKGLALYSYADAAVRKEIKKRLASRKKRSAK
jgi:hypothetical protein